MATIFGGVGSPITVSAANGGKCYAYNNLDDTTPVEVAPANPQRQRVTFHNPGTVDVLVFPSLKQNSGSDAANAVTVAAPGGAFLIYANGGERTVQGECQGAWEALSVSGSGNPLTVMDSNT